MLKNYLIAFCFGWSKGPVIYSPKYPCPMQTHYIVTQGRNSPILATISSMASFMAIFISYGSLLLQWRTEFLWNCDCTVYVHHDNKPSCLV